MSESSNPIIVEFDPTKELEVLGYSQEDAARVCGVSVSTIYKATRDGHVRKTSFGIYPREELRRWLLGGLKTEFERERERILAERKAGRTAAVTPKKQG
jgi:transcriptional regulator with XRE-family HTH domain